MLNIVPSYFYQFIPKILPNKTLFLKKADIYPEKKEFASLLQL